MGLEAGTFIGDLVPANPPGSDGKSQGDDHLRLIKSVLQATFPLAIGARKFRDDDAGATDTLTWLLFRNSASPQAADLLGSYAVSGNSSTAVERIYARLEARADVVTNGAEFGSWLMKTMVNGAETIIGEFNSFRPMTHQDFSTPGAFTWNRPAGCRKIIVEGCGGGGGAGGVGTGGANLSGSSAGGGSGFSGKTGLIDVTAIASIAGVIGAAGTGGSGAAQTAGSGGGNTTLAIGGYVWGGGGGSGGYTTVITPNSASAVGGLGGLGINLIGFSENGSLGRHTSSGGFNADGGIGGSGMYGRGGAGVHLISASSGNGSNASGFGAGAGGSAMTGAGSFVDGANGTAGFLRFWELY